MLANYDTETATANKSMGFDPQATLSYWLHTMPHGHRGPWKIFSKEKVESRFPPDF